MGETEAAGLGIDGLRRVLDQALDEFNIVQPQLRGGEADHVQVGGGEIIRRRQINIVVDLRHALEGVQRPDFRAGIKLLQQRRHEQCAAPPIGAVFDHILRGEVPEKEFGQQEQIHQPRFGAHGPHLRQPGRGQRLAEQRIVPHLLGQLAMRQGRAALIAVIGAAPTLHHPRHVQRRQRRHRLGGRNQIALEMMNDARCEAGHREFLNRL